MVDESPKCVVHVCCESRESGRNGVRVGLWNEDELVVFDDAGEIGRERGKVGKDVLCEDLNDVCGGLSELFAGDNGA